MKTTRREILKGVVLLLIPGAASVSSPRVFARTTKTYRLVGGPAEGRNLLMEIAFSGHELDAITIGKSPVTFNLELRGKSKQIDIEYVCITCDNCITPQIAGRYELDSEVYRWKEIK